MSTIWLLRSSPAAGHVLSILRMVVAFLFISAGTMKMFGFPSRGGEPIGFDPFTQIGLAAIIEVVGGTLVLFGLATRPAAFIMSGEMAVAYFQVVRSEGILPGHQWRRVSRAVLLDLLLFLVRWRRPMEPRCAHRILSPSIGAGEGGVHETSSRRTPARGPLRRRRTLYASRSQAAGGTARPPRLPICGSVGPRERDVDGRGRTRARNELPPGRRERCAGDCCSSPPPSSATPSGSRRVMTDRFN